MNEQTVEVATVETDEIETDGTADSAAAAVDTTDTDVDSVDSVDTVEDTAHEEEHEPARLPLGVASRLADPDELVSALEAILFVLDYPIAVTSLAASLELTVDTVQGALDTLRASYDDRRAGIELRNVAGGVRILTRAEHADVVEAFLRDGQRSRLSQAALETLAVIAYRQPVTRGRVSAIRGVNVDGVVRTLLARGLIIEVGTDPETGGGLYRTTELFLERMGLQSLDELPSLAPLLPDLEGLELDEV